MMISCPQAAAWADATMYLLERGVRLTGTDAWSWDAPFVHTAEKYARSHDAGLIWEGHKAGRDIGYCHGEAAQPGSAAARRLLHQLLPHKIRNASAGWTRAVAIFDDALMPGLTARAARSFNAPGSTRHDQDHHQLRHHRLGPHAHHVALPALHARGDRRAEHRRRAGRRGHHSPARAQSGRRQPRHRPTCTCSSCRASPSRPTPCSTSPPAAA